MRSFSSPESNSVVSEECQYVSEAMRLCSNPSQQMQLLLAVGLYHPDPLSWLSEPLNLSYFARAVAQKARYGSDCLTLCLLSNVFPGSLPELPHSEDYLLGADPIARLLARITFDGEEISEETSWEAHASFSGHVRNLDSLLGFHEPKAASDADLAKECLRRDAANALGVILPEMKDLFPVQRIHERANLISEALSSVLALNVGAQLAGTWSSFLDHPEVIKLKAAALEQIEQIPQTTLPNKREVLTIKAWAVARAQAMLLVKACEAPLPLRNRSEEFRLRFITNQKYDA